MTIIETFFIASAIVFAGVLMAAHTLQRKMIYFPDRERVAPEAMGLMGVQEVELLRPGNVRLVAWYTPARTGKPTLLYFHGNGGNLAVRADRIAAYQAQGIGVFMMSYRGYSGSDGVPSETLNVADALAAFDHLVGLGVPRADVVLYGESLGSGVAVQAAATIAANSGSGTSGGRTGAQGILGGVILDAPYTSIADVGAAAYPFLPVHLLIRDRYDTMAVIGQVTAPLLILHGEQDEVIPVKMGAEVFAAANKPKKLVTFPQAGHSDHHVYGAFEAALAWLEALPGAQLPR